MLDFLKNISIDESEIIKAAKKKGTGGGGHKKEWNPTHPYTIRIWKDGSVFPSADLVDRFSLEYGDRPVEDAQTEGTMQEQYDKEEKKPKWIQPGNAFDVFDSADFPAFKSPQRFILANVVSKASGKADLFASVTWDALTGKKENSVMEQGAATFGKKEFIGMIKDVYGVELNDETPHIDLVLLDQNGELNDGAPKHFQLPGDKKFCYVPKKVSRGATKGTETVVRREDPWLFVLYPLLAIHPELAPKKEEAKPAGAEPQD